jgi:hypothetical protein
MHKILHEFYFLISIKAWEMFLPHFQQPAKQSQPVLGTSTGPLLDDEYVIVEHILGKGKAPLHVLWTNERLQHQSILASPSPTFAALHSPTQIPSVQRLSETMVKLSSGSGTGETSTHPIQWNRIRPSSLCQFKERERINILHPPKKEKIDKKFKDRF